MRRIYYTKRVGGVNGISMKDVNLATASSVAVNHIQP